jgi:hypothetical protein
MRRVVMMVVALLAMTAGVWAEEKDKKFSPEKFQADLEQYITENAALTPEESARFFPVYRELGQKLRHLYQQQQQIEKSKPQGDANCREAIEQSDRLDIEMKQLQQQYHRRFMDILSSEKIYMILKAENRFYRRALRGMGNWPNDANHNKNGKRGGFRKDLPKRQ